MQSVTFDVVRVAIEAGRVHVSEHAYDEAVEDGLDVFALIDATPQSEVIEDYKDDPRGASCLVRVCLDRNHEPMHAVWGYDDSTRQAILITAYRPDPRRWSSDFRQRKPRA